MRFMIYQKLYDKHDLMEDIRELNPVVSGKKSHFPKMIISSCF